MRQLPDNQPTKSNGADNSLIEGFHSDDAGKDSASQSAISAKPEYAQPIYNCLPAHDFNLRERSPIQNNMPVYRQRHAKPQCSGF